MSLFWKDDIVVEKLENGVECWTYFRKPWAFWLPGHRAMMVGPKQTAASYSAIASRSGPPTNTTTAPPSTPRGET